LRTGVALVQSEGFVFFEGFVFLKVREGNMSNMSDVFGLRVPYGKINGQYQTEFEPATGTVWGYFNPKGTACYSLGMLKDILAHDVQLAANGAQVEIGDAMHPVHYYVTGSRAPRVFNLGGDLALFVLLIKSRDRDALAHYARLCIDNMYPRSQNFFSPTMTMISLVQGDALGGILFNLFPGMGAYSLLGRKIGMRAAEEMILSGRILPAKTLHEMGVIDVLAKDGEGEAAVQEWIARNDRRRNGIQAAFRARRCVNPITRDELDAITDVWVDAAFRLQERDLKMMGRIVRAQMRRTEIGDVTDVTATALEEERVACAA
jgi:DSF synthase